VADETELRMQEDKQRVIDDTPIITVPRITNLPTIMKTRNPTAKRALKGTKCLHRRVTRNNTPGTMPVLVIAQDCNAATQTILRQSTRMQQQPHVRPTGAHHGTSNQCPYLTGTSIIQYGTNPTCAHEIHQNAN
jgi:hypothetical protein